MNAIFVSGIFMSFFIALLLVRKRNKALSDKILAVWVALIGIHLLGYYLNQLGYWEKYPHLIGTTAPFPLFHGPLLFLYTLYSLRSDTTLRKVDYLHFLPVTLAYIYMSGFFFFYSAEEKTMVDRGELPDFEVFTGILLITFMVSGISYAILAYRLTRRHQQKIDENFSYQEGINLNWLRQCILAVGAFFLTAAIVVVARQLVGINFNFNADYVFYSMIILFIFYIGYFGIRHQDMFTDNISSIPKLPPQNPEAKYKKTGLTDEVVQDVHLKLLEHMKTHKPYLDPKLSLVDLAEQLALSANQLSQVINQKEQVNFHDFVNKYRVEEFIERATKNTSFSLLGNALDAGFNSKSSFNSVFKKHKGVTPSQYLAELKIESVRA